METCTLNGSSTPSISIQRGLEHGNPLTPFIFVLVVEGLNDYVVKVEELDLYFIFKVDTFRLVVSYLYNANILFSGRSASREYVYVYLAESIKL